MFGSPEVKDWLDAAKQRHDFLRNQSDQFAAEKKRYEQEVERLQGILDRTRQELVGQLLPEIEDGALHRLETRLRYEGGLLTIKQRFEEQLAAVAREQAELETRDEIANHEFHLYRVNDDLASLKDSYISLKHELDTWQSNPHFVRLEVQGYFKPEYSAGLFRAIADWREVSFLMAELEERLQKPERYEGAEALRQDYARLRAEADPVIEAYTDLLARKKELTELKARHDELCVAPAKIGQELYQALGEALRGHLDACPEQLRLELATDDPTLALSLTKEMGLRKQIQYLRELVVARIDNPLGVLNQQINELLVKIHKVESKQRRGKAVRIKPGSASRLRDVRADSWTKRHQQLSSLRTRIGGFDRYDRGSFLEHYLWWDIMTRGARGDDIYEVRVFREHHPDWDHRSYQTPWGGDLGGPGSAQALDQAAFGLADEMLDHDPARTMDAS